MSACTFFGHSRDFGLNVALLQNAIEKLILQGTDTFYVGNQGYYDARVLGCLKRLKKDHPHIRFSVVLAYLPTELPENDIYSEYSIFPEELDTVHPKFAIDRRNRWMIDRSDICLCWVDFTWGGAYKFAGTAKKKGLTVINIGRAEL